VLLCGMVLYAGLAARDRWAVEQPSRGRSPQPLDWGRAAGPVSLFAWLLLGMVLLAPFGRIVFELGLAGPEAPGSWGSRAGESVQAAIERGREDIGRSLRHGVLAGLVALFLAPFLAHGLNRLRGWRGRVLTTLMALPLLAPGVGYGMGAIAFANRPGWGEFYQGTSLVVLVYAGRFLPIAVFLLAERFRSVPRSREDSATIAGLSFPRRLWHAYVAPQLAACWLAAGLVVVFAVRELDLAILLPGANQSAAVRYFNALHFARDGFVAAFGLLIAIILFLPVMLYAAWKSFRRDDA
jgi:iron(III) transport system permease protein